MALPLLTSASKLSTPFDYWAHRIHALLGFYVLCHFLYRYGMFFFFSSQDGGHDDMGFDVPTSMGVFEHTIVFVKLFMPHLLLQCTGFAFPLPTKRHPDGNRIWPQYRWEAVVFCIRCISLAFIAWRRKLYKQQTLEDGSCSIFPALCCVGLTMLSADKVATWYRTNENVGVTTGNRTIRDLTAPKWAQYFMSSAQFHATVHCLLTSNRLSVQIAALAVVQLSAFGMTLRRKGFITQKEGVLLYALVLLMGMLVIMDDLRRRSLFHLAISFGNSAAVLRMYVGMDKYVLWAGVAAALAYLQRQGMLNDSFFQWSAVMNISSWVLLLLGCYLKHR